MRAIDPMISAPTFLQSNHPFLDGPYSNTHNGDKAQPYRPRSSRKKEQEGGIVLGRRCIDQCLEKEGGHDNGGMKTALASASPPPLLLLRTTLTPAITVNPPSRCETITIPTHEADGFADVTKRFLTCGGTINRDKKATPPRGWLHWRGCWEWGLELAMVVIRRECEGRQLIARVIMCKGQECEGRKLIARVIMCKRRECEGRQLIARVIMCKRRECEGRQLELEDEPEQSNPRRERVSYSIVMIESRPGVTTNATEIITARDDGIGQGTAVGSRPPPSGRKSPAGAQDAGLGGEGSCDWPAPEVEAACDWPLRWTVLETVLSPSTPSRDWSLSGISLETHFPWTIRALNPPPPPFITSYTSPLPEPPPDKTSFRESSLPFPRLLGCPDLHRTRESFSQIITRAGPCVQILAEPFTREAVPFPSPPNTRGLDPPPFVQFSAVYVLAGDFLERAVEGRGQCCVVVRLLASHVGEPGTYPRFSHVGIMPDYAAGLEVFSRISRFPLPFNPALLHTHLASSSSVLKASMLRSVQITAGMQGRSKLEIPEKKNPADQRHRPARFPLTKIREWRGRGKKNLRWNGYYPFKALAYLEPFPAFAAEYRGSDKGDTTMCIKYAIAAKRKALN
ncbi:hypothetical protein PR048_031025 [Dryococelus australis]|uniref:Uncharacterized protein n=1 Tax=Dryococelus australis TaxID=614101 RepID=A0ABQ9G5A3_9NEOP|nr:hypothetical protein PR048_031025 [Dryococelus australis]